MSRFSIKKRVTFWYALSFLIIVCLVLFFLLTAGDRLVQDNLKDALTDAVDRSVKDVRIYDGKLTIDDDLIDYIDGVYVAVYEKDVTLTGNLPDKFPEDTKFVPDEARKIKSKDGSYFVYERLIENPKHEDVWIRGVTSASMEDAAPEITLMIRLFLIGLPILLIIATLGGYWITRGAFAPINRINETVSRIQEGRDLSRRIELGGEDNTKDEIYTTAQNFDNMLERLEDSFETEKQFTGNASHELRTPVSVIMSQCEYALENIDDIEEAKEAFAVILGQSKKMSSLISQLLTLARADQGIEKINRENISLSAVAETVCEDVQPMAAKKNIDLIKDIAPDIYVHADRSMMSRIFINLISNAISYGRDSGFVKISLKVSGASAVGTIEDNGIGISEEALPKIWDRFYQADASRSSGEENSLGLGLSMVQWMITAHGGSIEARSVLGKGSTFQFKIPLKKI